MKKISLFGGMLVGALSMSTAFGQAMQDGQKGDGMMGKDDKMGMDSKGDHMKPNQNAMPNKKKDAMHSDKTDSMDEDKMDSTGKAKMDSMGKDSMGK